MKRPVWTQKDVCRGPLILVNASHPIPAKRPPRLAPALPDQGNVLLESHAAKSLAACVKASGAQGRIRAVSGWRSRAEQRQIWNDSLRENGEAFTRSYVALPGCSEHETGLAIDLAAEAPEIDFIRPDFPRDGVFAVFQCAMPLIGWVCIHTVVQYFQAFEKLIPWIALVLLCFIGGKMLIEGIRNRGGCESEDAGLGIGALMVQGIATSIDALSVGFTIAEYGALMAVAAALIIAVVTFVICTAGVLIGQKFGTRLSNKAQILGGVILIVIGIEIFVTGII